MKRTGFISDSKISDSEPNRCRWETQGRRCQHRGTIGHVSEGRSDLYCSWHHGKHPKENTAGEFTRWLDQSYPERQVTLSRDATERTKARWANIWVSQPAMELWQMANGG